ncbi:MAG: S1C family serine protease, partial [bacterium]|nr:S1C family serine protease [bacterium]
ECRDREYRDRESEYWEREDRDRDGEYRDKKEFMQEKIIGRQRSRGSTLTRVLVFCLAAILFGAIMTATFVYLRPWMEKRIGRNPRRETAQVTIPTDEMEAEVIPETMEQIQTEEDVEESESSAETSERLEQEIQEALETYAFTMDDLEELYMNLRQVVMQADKGIVKIRSVNQDIDWFDNQFETEGQFAGALIAKTEDELIFMAPLEAVQNADSLEISLSSTLTVKGYVKQTDTQTGIAIVCVDVLETGGAELSGLTPIPLGNSWSVSQGDIVIAVGSPVGKVHSSIFASISYIEKNVSVPDGSVRMLYTDMHCDGEKGTFLLNTKGQLVGWITDLTDIPDMEEESVSVAYGISDYKVTLEKLTNGIPMPYLGIYGQEISEEMKENGIPAGVYVLQCQNNSPAYQAGIQNGDILVEIEGASVRSMKELQLQLEGLQSEQSVTVKVRRKSREEYRELSYTVVLGSR